MGRASLDMSLTFMRIIISCDKTNSRLCLRAPLRSWFLFRSQLVLVSHHVSVLLVGKVESWQDGFEFVQDLVVSGHVRGQDAPAGQAEWGIVETLKRRGKANTQAEGRSHLMIPSLIRLYWSTARFRKMLLSVWKGDKCFLTGCLV